LENSGCFIEADAAPSNVCRCLLGIPFELHRVSIRPSGYRPSSCRTTIRPRDIRTLYDSGDRAARLRISDDRVVVSLASVLILGTLAHEGLAVAPRSATARSRVHSRPTF
jgi:hypothetical protein